MYELRNFNTANGKDVFDDWLEGLTDLRAHAAIMARLDRLESGAFGDVKSIEAVSANYGLMSVPGIGCISRNVARRFFCCSAAVTNHRKAATSNWLSNT